MARLKVLSNDELVKLLESKEKVGKNKYLKLKPEIDMCWSFYQGIPRKTTMDGGLDSQQALAQFFSRATDESYDSLDSTRPASLMLFLQGKLCISDPSVVAKPYNRDTASIEGAKYAQLVVEHIKQTTNMQSVMEAGMFLDTAVTGTGIMYHGWNADAGQVSEVIESPSGEDEGEVKIKMTGDFEFRSVDTSRFLIDDTAKIFDVDANWCREARDLPIEMAVYLFPEKAKMIQELAERQKDRQLDSRLTKDVSATRITVSEYWEKRTVWNGMLGLHVIYMMDEEKVMLLYRGPNSYEHGELPYSVLTDVDIKDDAWGMGRATIASAIIDVRNRFLAQVMNNIDLHGSIQLMVPEGAVQDDALKSNNTAKVLTYNAAMGDAPKQLQPSSVTSDIWRLDVLMQKELDELFGASEFSRGEIPRELSSYAVTMATETDDKFRVRLFNKKKSVVKRVFSQCLSYAKQFITEPRMFKISGQEESHNYEYFKASDLAGHYGIFVDFGMWMPVDPYARKQQVLELLKSGAFEKAGGDMKKLISVLVDGDMLDIQDMFEDAKRVQREEILRMINGEEAPVNPYHEHLSHFSECASFMQKKNFEVLPDEVKKAIYAHSEEHKMKAAALQAAAQGGQQQLPQGEQPQQPAQQPPAVGEQPQGAPAPM